MTKSQRITLMADWWPKACKAQGWDEDDRDKRLQVLSEAVGRELKSANDLNSTDDIDAVKAHLGKLADNLAATRETLEDGYWIGEARRLRDFIRNDQLPCLGIYVADAPAYMASIIDDKKDKWRFSFTPTLDDLNAEPITYFDQRARQDKTIPSQLKQVMMTLARSIQSKRTAAGHTIHDMRTRAGLPCDCKACRQSVPAPQQYSKANSPF